MSFYYEYLRSQERKRKKCEHFLYRLCSTDEIKDRSSRRCECFYSKRTINYRPKHTYNAKDKVNFFLLIVKNQFFYENQFFDSNSNELTIDQLQTILNNDHIRQHLIEVGYVSVLLL